MGRAEERSSRRWLASLFLLWCTGPAAIAAGSPPASSASPPAPSASPPASSASPPRAASRPRAITLQEALAIALENNPELQGTVREIDAALARKQGASLLLQDNPQVVTSAGPRSADGDDSVDWSVGIAQRVEIGGQRAVRIEAADAGLRVAEARLVARRSALMADVREAVGLVVATEELSRVAEEALELAKDGLAAATERHEAGGASLIEVNTARIEFGRATRDAATARQDGDAALAALGLLLGAPDDLAVVPGGGLMESRICEEAPEALLAAARKQRGDLVAARAELEQAQAEQHLAEREAIASPSIGVAYNRDENADIVLATFSVSLPIFDRNQLARGVAGARLAQAKLALASRDRAVANQVGLALAECRVARSIVESYRGDVVRAAQSNLELANEGYLAGKLDVLQLLRIRREALDARRGAVRGLQRRIAADAQMMRATGGES